MFKSLAGLIFASALSFSAPTANAAVSVHLWNSGGNVEAQASGTLNLSGLIFAGGPFGFSDDFRVQPNGAEVLFFGRGNLYRALTNAPNFGTGSNIFEPFQSEGDHFGWERSSIVTPVGFTSGGSIFSTGRILSNTLAGIGAIAGTYEWTLPSDKITLYVGQSPTEVPLPAALPLLAGGIGILGFLGWRRKNAA